MTMLAAALKLAEKGFAVFPCLPHAKEPRTPRGFLDATKDPAVITAWYRGWSNCNVGIATGAPSNVVVIDVDVKHDGEKSVRQMESEFGPLPPSVESVTPSGGRHVFYRHPGWPVGCSVGKLASGVDVRGDGGYVIAPPSIHPNGRRYFWSVDSAGAFADAPQWLLEKIRAVAAPANGNGAALRAPPSEWRDLVAADVPEGARNATVTKLVGHLLRNARYVDPVVVFELVRCWDLVHCQPPLGTADVVKIFNSIAAKEQRRRECLKR
jgi:Bifunctional DNA primase/polymerase, N-terminal/Primase C terminal 1 (PriCT-1)